MKNRSIRFWFIGLWNTFPIHKQILETSLSSRKLLRVPHWVRGFQYNGRYLIKVDREQQKKDESNFCTFYRNAKTDLVVPFFIDFKRLKKLNKRLILSSTCFSLFSSLKHSVNKLTCVDFSRSTLRASMAWLKYLFTRFVGCGW